MELFAAVVAEFGKRLGMEALRPDERGFVELDFEGRGRLMLEERDGTAFATLAREWPRHSENAARKAAEMCHWNRNHPWNIHPGCKGEEWLTFTIALPERELDLPGLEKMVAYLLEMAAAV